MRPLERFLQLEAGSASLLLGAAVAALVWANLASDSYDRFWTTTVSVGVGSFTLEEDLRHLVNDLLMAVFFYVVALEVKRELLFGSLRDRRSALVPGAAALGTMVGGALAYVAVNLIADGDLRGWAIPIATDIAFAVGVLGLAGARAPKELRAFMLTLAVIDDLGTILVIAVFFSQGLSLAWLAAAGGVVLVILVAQRIGVRAVTVYVLLAAALWLAVFESGVHATLAGVVLGFLTPAVAFQSSRRVTAVIGERLTELAGADAEVSAGTLLETSRLAEEAVSPLVRMEERVHPWSAYLILPLFALANAGVPVSIGGLADALSSPIGAGIALGLVVGAPLGGFVFARAIVDPGPARIPAGLDWAAIAGVTPLKGIGFTIAIFISALAFEEQELQDQATLAILAGSTAAAAIGLAVLYARSLFVRPQAP
ncbi:MAG TPA: Na+/H+ antiporter NhaA [Gaiellaceae bacterium]|nr:Na+/H+ antiporter NhaA [Gaiellaceae bacterium]